MDKIEVAKRQLETAIRLFFVRADPISIFTLAANAWEIVDALCTLRGIDSVSNQTREHVAEKKDLKYDYINSPFRNFFKHADRDPEERLDGFTEEKCDSILFLAVEDYIRLMRKSPLEFQVFQLWYLAIYIEKVSDDALERILEGTDRIFPRIRELPRQEQIGLGAKALATARSDPSALADPRTEPSSEVVTK